MRTLRILFVTSIVLIFGGAFLAVSYFVLPERYAFVVGEESFASTTTLVVRPVVLHVSTPTPVRAIYMTACVASSAKWRDSLVKLIEETELNSLIIDVKDYTGTISLPSDDPELIGTKGTGCKVPDMPAFLTSLHKKGIYVIGRIAVFQDPLSVKHFPEYAVKKSSDKSVVWKDGKGLPFIDVGAEPYWEYIERIGRVAYEQGFDELNFDYIRFPSDGNMKDIYFPWSNATITADRKLGKAIVVRSFFEYLHQAFASTSVKTSADLFGMTTTNTDDLNIGQILEYAAPNFDYLAPMVYPSHYPKGFNGYADVNKHPYDIVKYSMDRAVARLIVATTTPMKLRPWLQDNNYPVPYTADMVRAQMKATYDAGLDSWMLWDPANRYTRGALLGPEKGSVATTTAQ